MSDRKESNINETPKYEVKPYDPRDYQPSPDIRYIDYPTREDVHLRDYLGVVLKRKWVVLTFLISVMIITMTVTFMMIPLYKSTVVIRIDRASQDVDPLKSVQIIRESDYYQTQYEILKSQTLADKVIRKLALDKNRDFLTTKGKLQKVISSVIGSIVDFFSEIGASDQPKTKRPPGQTPLYLLSLFNRNLDVIPVKNSQMVQVSFSSKSPELAMKVTRAIADAYIEYSLDSRVDASKNARDFLAKQIESTKARVERSENLLNEYASQNEIIFLDSDKQSVLSRKLGDISSALSAETTERMQKEALYRQLRESGTDNPVILNNSLIMGLKNQYATLEAEYRNLSRTFTPDYPKMKNLKSQLDAIRESIDREKSNLLRSVKSDYHASQKKEAYLKSELESQKMKVLNFQERAVKYQTLKREVDVNKELHNNLLQKLNEVGIAAMSQATNIQIIDYPRYPTIPYTPQKLLNFVLSVIFGLMGGVGLAFLVEYFDSTVKDTGEIENRLRLPSLGMIPYQPKLNLVKRPRVISSETSDPIAEAFRSISTFVVLSSSTKPPKTILVTSPGEKEGKTTVCINIASALAESLGKGIIVDADMRKPKLHQSFDVDNKKGLSTCLAGYADFSGIEDLLIKPTSVNGLSILTSGPQPPNPSRLLHSRKMKDLLDALHEIYNFVIIDAPPLMGMPDSVLLSSMVDGTILVVKAGETPRNAVTTAKQIFNNVNGNLLGVVLNGVKMSDVKYGSYSHYFSSYFKG